MIRREAAFSRRLILSTARTASTSEDRTATLGSPIFPSGCEGKLGVALESLQGKIDLI